MLISPCTLRTPFLLPNVSFQIYSLEHVHFTRYYSSNVFNFLSYLIPSIEGLAKFYATRNLPGIHLNRYDKAYDCKTNMTPSSNSHYTSTSADCLVEKGQRNPVLVKTFSIVIVPLPGIMSCDVGLSLGTN